MPDPAAGKRLRALLERSKRGDETWDVVARSVGVTKASVMAWMAGKNEPDLDSLRRIGARLDMPRWAVLKEWDGE